MRLEPVSEREPGAVLAALRAALDHDGPAVGLGLDGEGQAVGLGGDGAGRAQGASACVDVPDGTAVVIATSGSTGTPKRVIITRHALIASARATAARIGAGGWLLALPVGYIAGIQVLTRCLVQGEEPTPLAGRFTAESFTDAAGRMAAGPRYTSLVPAQLATVLNAADAGDAAAARALRSFEAVLVGGQALPPALLARARGAGVRVVRTYGSTETSGGCVYDGVPLDGVAVRVRDGEVQLSGATLATGYLDDPALTDAVFPHDRDGTRWYRTGDSGVVVEGVLHVHGRLDNVIVSGGINVSLDRVEQLVRAVPGLQAAVVLGVAHPRWGEASAIVAVRGARPRDTEADLLEQARAAVTTQIGAHARPVRLVLVDEMPMLASGKPDRAAILAMVC